MGNCCDFLFNNSSELFLGIDPDEYVDRTLCVPECQVDAIYAENDVPSDMQHYTVLNTELAPLWKPIVEKKRALPEANKQSRIKEKFGLLHRE